MFRFALITACAALLFTGCGDDDHDHDHEHSESHDTSSETGTTAGDASAAADDATTAADDTTAPGPIEVTNELTANDWLSEEPIEGAELCINAVGEEAECVTTDAEGKASITATVVDGEHFQLRGDKDGYYPFLVEGIISDVQEGGVFTTTWAMAPTLVLEVLASALESELDDTKGQATILILGPVGEDGTRPSVEGATLALSGTAEHGPKYLNTAEEVMNAPFVDDATGTSASGAASFFNIDPGTVDITVTAEGHTCSPGAAGLPSETGSVSGTIEAGRVTYLVVICAPTE